MIGIVISLLVLFSINILMISSLAPHLLGKQLIAWIIGIIAFFIGRLFHPKQLYPIRNHLFIFSCLILFFPIIANTITRGSRRWLYFGAASLQPSEIVKPLLMIFLSHTSFPFLHLIPVTIIALQPDLGSAISNLVLLVPNILTNRRLFKASLILSFFLLFSLPIVWKSLLHDYQKNRVLTFLDPSTDPLGQGYNTIQAKIAIGSGTIFGKGYKKGSQGQLLFLPEKHTDFMFAATAEELGLISVIIILAIYYLLINKLISKAFATKNSSLFIFTLGTAIQIWFPVFVNIGMNLGILPVTGIPLPFLSVGGSTIISLLFSLGVVFSG